LAEQGHFPAIDVLASVSRVRSRVTTKEHQVLAGEVTRLLAAYRDVEDLIQIGAYAKGNNAEVDRAITLLPRLRDYLRQQENDDATIEQSVQALAQLLASP
jgi:flagellum-specific ATP synthase